MRYLKIPGLRQCGPVRLRERSIATDFRVGCDRHQQQRGGIRGCEWIRQAFPVHQISRLRPFVNDLSLGTLPPQQEFEFVARECEISIAVHRVKSPQSITTEVPAKAGTSRIA